MPPTYRSAPTMQCNAPAKSFPTALEALRHARQAADGYRVGYQVYEVLAGRPKRLAAFHPGGACGGGPPMRPDPFTRLFEGVRGLAVATYPGHAPVSVVVVYDDGRRAELPVPPACCAIADDEAFVPTPVQQAVLDALDGKALRSEALGAAVGDRSRLYRPGGLKELRERGLVDHHERLGFFRPDAPPEALERGARP